MADAVPSDDHLDGVFHALASKPRRQILGRLTSGPLRVTDIAGHFDVSLNTVSKHLKVLERAGLVQREIKGRAHVCRANEQALEEAQRWITRYREFWSLRLERLDHFLTTRSEGDDSE